jgi:hypothetical protein
VFRNISDDLLLNVKNRLARIIISGIKKVHRRLNLDGIVNLIRSSALCRRENRCCGMNRLMPNLILETYVHV